MQKILFSVSVTYKFAHPPIFFPLSKKDFFLKWLTHTKKKRQQRWQLHPTPEFKSNP